MTHGGRIRNLAVGILVREGHLLAEEYPVIPGYHRFVRAIGGGIEFGERAVEALHREFEEELGVALEGTRLLAVSENLFTILDDPGHEVVHIFAIECRALERIPVGARRSVLDAESTVGWYPLEGLARDDPPLYPAGVLDAARSLGR